MLIMFVAVFLATFAVVWATVRAVRQDAIADEGEEILL